MFKDEPSLSPRSATATPQAPAKPGSVAPAALAGLLSDGAELALLDVREPGQFGEGHLFDAVNVPYSRLEIEAVRLVPRRSTRIVLAGEEGNEALAARRLAALGYSDVQVLAGGLDDWSAAGHPVFKGINVRSKTFGEWAEHAAGTPSIDPADFAARVAAGERFVLVDGRTLVEHARITLPGSVPLPNGELALRIGALIGDDPRQAIVVHCAGRTRSIVGAQILRDLGLPNPVHALEDGLQGWYLRGLAPVRGSVEPLPPVPDAALLAQARERVRALASRNDVPAFDDAQAQRWLDDPARTTYLFDVRTPAEYARGSLPGAQSAEGGQLLQATDLFIGVQNARVLLLDDDGVRAPVIALWLRRLGIEAATVAAGLAETQLTVPKTDAPDVDAVAPPLRKVPVDAVPLWNATAALRLDLRPSRAYRQGHPARAQWGVRPRLPALVPAGSREVLLIADDAQVAALAAVDLRELGVTDIVWASAEDWREGGGEVDGPTPWPADADAIDFLFFVHDRHDGNLDAARGYLAWEKQLLAQCTPAQVSRFNGWTA